MNICSRCGKKFDNPYPKIVNPERNTEIACINWCADCNRIAMSALLRQGGAYWSQGKRPPWQGEKNDT